jgi:hypothetical protein
MRSHHFAIDELTATSCGAVVSIATPFATPAAELLLRQVAHSFDADSTLSVFGGDIRLEFRVETDAEVSSLLESLGALLESSELASSEVWVRPYEVLFDAILHVGCTEVERSFIYPRHAPGDGLRPSHPSSELTGAVMEWLTGAGSRISAGASLAGPLLRSTPNQVMEEAVAAVNGEGRQWSAVAFSVDLQSFVAVQFLGGVLEVIDSAPVPTSEAGGSRLRGLLRSITGWLHFAFLEKVSSYEQTLHYPRNPNGVDLLRYPWFKDDSIFTIGDFTVLPASISLAVERTLHAAVPDPLYSLNGRCLDLREQVSVAGAPSRGVVADALADYLTANPVEALPPRRWRA